MDNCIKQRRKMFKENAFKIIRAQGENSVAVTNPNNSKLIQLKVNVLETATADEKMIVFRGKNLFNPLREFQSGKNYLGTMENLKAGIEAGQMLFFGISCSTEIGGTFSYAVPNQYWIICPVLNGLSYVISLFKSKILLLDENLTVLKMSETKTIYNDVNAKYVCYYCYNSAQSPAIQTWTFEDVLNKGQIEIGEVETEHEAYVEPQTLLIPMTINYDGTGKRLPLNKGEMLEVDYLAGIVKYNGELLPSQADFCQSILGLSCPTNNTRVETIGINSMITAIYYN